MDDKNRNGLPASARDTTPAPPPDFVSDPRSSGYNPRDSRHANTYGLGHDHATPERTDSLNAFHRKRGREIRTLEKQLPADGYMNTFTSSAEQQQQWEAHPLTLTGSLTEGDVRKGEYTMSKFLEQHRWYTEYGKAYNSKQFMLNLSTTHAEDLCNFASYDAYITGSNKIFYLHEHFKSAVWKDVENTGFAADSTYQIPFRPSSQLKLLHLTTMVNVTEAQFRRFADHDDPMRHAELRPGSNAGALQHDNNFVPGTPNAGIDEVWGREAALLPNNPVLPKFRNCGFKRETVGGGSNAVIRLAPVNPQFVRS